MNVELCQVTVDEKEILKNLLEKYDYEFSQWDLRDVNPLGLYGYEYLDYYWNEKNRFAYFIKVDGKLAGFVMINEYPEAEDVENDFQMAEFFVHKYRKLGVGKIAACRAFDMHRGLWQLKRHPHNIPSVFFWNKVISEYTKGNYKLVESYPNSEYDDGTLGDIYFFDNSLETEDNK